ncbi:MAG: hypothetical protein ABS76_36815 [Pelagibacterium sp. SCN 64-44]|nr:MAG: hypothetical protein ABS76_36815 [Pelagibacterium sp. SCN 64-44]
MALSKSIIEELRAEMKRPDRRTMSQIAKDLGCTKGVIAGAFSRANIRMGDFPQAKVERLESQRGRIETLAAANTSAFAIAREIGCSERAIQHFCDERGIHLHVRVRTPKPQQATVRASMRGLFGKQKPLSSRDRAEMNRLRDEAIAAGRITRLPAGHAYGSKTFFRSEYA